MIKLPYKLQPQWSHNLVKCSSRGVDCSL